jgi:hypothetical protein
MAPLLLHELEGATVSASGIARARLRPGVVYVPCALCRAPIDVTTIRSADQPRLCARHAD